MNTPNWSILLVLICVLLAGCNGFSTSADSSTPVPQTTTSIPENTRTTAATTSDRVGTDDLPVDEGRTVARMEALLGTTIASPTIQAERIDKRPLRQTDSPDPFTALMNMSIAYPPVRTAGGATYRNHIEIFYVNGTDPALIEHVLAHELVHVTQPTALREPSPEQADSPYEFTTDAQLARTSLIEGSAVYGADQYATKYLPAVERSRETYERNWQDWPTGLRLYWAPYYHGTGYVAGQVSSPSELQSLYQNIPLTTEQILHEYKPHEEPVQNVTVVSQDTNSSWDATTVDSKGELFIRLMLADTIPRNQAQEAASGWGYDRAITYYNGSRAGHAWTLTWDSGADATEFNTALTAYLTNRATKKDNIWYSEMGTFRIEQPANDTVVLLAGDLDFVESTSVTQMGDTVTISPS